MGTAPADDLLLSIGGVVCLSRLGSCPVLKPLMAERYGLFRLPCAPACAPSCVLDWTEGPAPERGPSVGPGPVVRVTDKGVSLSRRDFEARLVPSAGRDGRAIWRGTCRCAVHPHSADALLRTLWSVLLPRAGGALFHACAVRHGGGGLLFPGVSGAGKTTIARKVADGGQVLSDELVPVRADADGLFRACPSPFWGGYAIGGASMRGVPLALVVFPRKGRREAAAALTPAETAHRLLATLLCFEAGAEVAAANVAFAARLGATVPGVELETAVDTPFPDLVRALAPWLGKAALACEPPASPRERISDLRARLRATGAHAFRADGDSMRPAIRDGDTVFVEPCTARDAVTGDVLLYWKPGPGPEDDILVCHRLVGRRATAAGTRVVAKGDASGTIERFTDGREAGVLGRVVAVARDGRTRRLGGRAGSLVRLAGSLATLPLQRIRS